MKKFLLGTAGLVLAIVIGVGSFIGFSASQNSCLPPAGNTNAEKAFNFLTTTAITTNGNRPMSAAQAAGVVGNLMRESGGDTYDIKTNLINSRGAHGIVQWLGVRWSSSNGNGLKEFAAEKGTEWTDLQTQLEFIIFELEKTEPAVIKDAAFKNAANTPEGAATAAARWAQLYERPGPPPYAAREKNAQKAFNDFAVGATARGADQSSVTSLSQSTDAGCSSSVGGYVFPLQGSKADIRKWGNNPGTDEWKSGRYHEQVFPGYYGVDIYAPEGTPVLAFHSGEVIHIRNGDSYGALSIQIKDDEGYTYYYQHLSLSRGAKVNDNQKVEAGTVIGYVGNLRESWNTTPHLHIDKSKNPGDGTRGECTASKGYCPIASEHRFVEIVKELHDSYEGPVSPPANRQGWTKPLDGTLRIGSPWGRRYHPILHYWRLHDGIDLSASQGKRIYSIGVGTVVFRGYNSGAGNYVSVDYGDGYVVSYMHMSRFGSFRVGDRVNTGDILGYVGSTGLSTAPHLHFGLKKNGKGIDPVPWLCTKFNIPGPKGCSKLT